MICDLKCVLQDLNGFTCDIVSVTEYDFKLKDESCFSFYVQNGIKKPTYNDSSNFIYKDLLPYTYNDLLTKILF